MLHFFPTFSPDAANSEFGRALGRIGAPHRIFSNYVAIGYRNRLHLLFVIIPRFAVGALRSAIKSLVFSHPKPTHIILGTDVEILIFALVRFLTGQRGTRIVLGSFIFTNRSVPWKNTLRKIYFRMVLSQVSVAIVHSRNEVEKYGKIFSGSPVKFMFVPWGTSMERRSQFVGDAAFALGKERRIVSAGRSGRDYGTLFRATEALDIELRVICDFLTEKPAEDTAARISILRKCYGDDYLRELVDASVVVIPLAVDDISAGQMVAIQSMALGKAVIITDTPTVRDYVIDQHDAILVPQSDPIALRQAISNLLAAPQERERLGRNAFKTFTEKLSTEGYLRGLIAAIGER
jgi:glycosyltransferase involved in cell wall biosynthesis